MTADVEPTYLVERTRDAAEHVLANTALGASLETFAGVARLHDGTLRIEVDAELREMLSSGEQVLLGFVEALAVPGRGADLWHLLNRVDRESQFACVWALGIATGHFEQMTPVRFGGAL